MFVGRADFLFGEGEMLGVAFTLCMHPSPGSVIDIIETYGKHCPRHFFLLCYDGWKQLNSVEGFAEFTLMWSVV